jgi:predicted SAM-dependent methyltransferase
MTREEKVLGLIDKNKIGLEIGPSFSPFAPKKNGFNVHIIDHMNKKQLVEKYTPHNINLDSIEEVDYVWSGQTYAALTGKKNYYNWIIASHLIEHTPDLVSFLKQCEEVLTDDGILSLVIPDVRYHFDYFRPITGISKIIDAYYNKNTIHTAGTAAEYFLNFSKRAGTICWSEGFKGELALEFTKSDALTHMQTVTQQNAYLDLHAWSFTPTSFRLIIQDLNDLGFISLKEVAFYPSAGCEFYITLGKMGIGFLDHRMDALKTIKAELSL